MYCWLVLVAAVGLAARQALASYAPGRWRWWWGKREIVLTRAEVLAAYPTGVVPVGIGAGGTAGASVTNAGAQAAITENRAATLRSAQLPQPMAAVVVGLALVLLLQVLVDAEAASVQKAPLRPHRAHMALAAGGSGGSPTGVNSVGCGSGGCGGPSSGGTGSTGVYAVDGGAGAGAGGGVSAANAASAGSSGGPRFGGQPEPLAVQAAHPALLALRALPPLLAGCLGKAVVVAGLAMAALAVQAVLVVVALAVVGVAQHAVHTPLAPVVSAAMAGHWYWSIDYAAICRC